MNCNHPKELSELISQVEELHFQLMEMRDAEEQAHLWEKRQRLRAYQKEYYKHKVKFDEAKMEKRREYTRKLRKDKSTKEQKVPLQGLPQGKEAQQKGDDVFVVEF